MKKRVHISIHCLAAYIYVFLCCSVLMWRVHFVLNLPYVLKNSARSFLKYNNNPLYIRHQVSKHSHCRQS